MEYLALYRKYRPKTFDGIYGQDHIVQTLKNQIATGKISHAYLFCGTRGTGKTSIAKIFARAVNCLDNEKGNPCLKCENCTLPDSANVDVIEMDAASNTGVDYARDLREKAQYAPTKGRYKVYIIDEVHMLSTSAFNALLKTLEEPPKHVVFILCTTEVHKLPATILSRCMRFDFKLLSQSLLIKLLKGVFDAEGKQYTEDALAGIATSAEGSARDCLSIADRCYSMCEKLDYESVMSVLGVSSRQAVLDLCKAILTGDVATVLHLVHQLNSQGKDLGLLNRDLSKNFTNVLVAKTCADADKLLLLPSDVMKQLKEIADVCTKERLILALNRLQKLDGELKYSLAPLSAFCSAVLTVAISGGEVDVVNLERRVAKLEQLPQNVNNETTIVVDKTSATSIWKAVKVEISRANAPLLLGLWQESQCTLQADTLWVTSTPSAHSLLSGEFAPTVRAIVKKLVAKDVVFQSTQPKEEPQDDHLLSLGKNVKIK